MQRRAQLVAGSNPHPPNAPASVVPFGYNNRHQFATKLDVLCCDLRGEQTRTQIEQLFILQEKSET